MARRGGFESQGGRLDRTAVMYVIGGIPAMVAFFVALFALVHACGIPA